jgi:pimeloyl-ACP methyl ester carboxylesterase
VVCLPGLSRTVEDFDILATALSDGSRTAARRVVALDYRGRGLSDWDPDPRNYDLRVESSDITTVLTALGIARAIFVGTSRGGLHVMMLGALRPAFLAGAVLNDIGPVIAAEGLSRIKGYIGKLPQPKSWDEAVLALKQIAGGHFTGLDAQAWEAYARLTFQEKDGVIGARYDPGLMENLKLLDLDAIPELWPQFEGLQHIPLQIIRGANSDLLSATTADEMVRRHPNCDLVVVPGQGHAPLLMDDPTIDNIVAFVTRCDARELAGLN